MVEIWRLVTDLDKKKQALAVALSLTGRARDSVLETPTGDLNKDVRMTTLLIKLDSVFLKEEKDRQYKTHMEYDRITKDSSVSMVDYIVEFEQRYNRIHQFKMELLDVVLAFKLLDTAGLNVKDKQLALTACPSLLFDNMKAALKKTFGDVMPQRGGNGPRLSRDATDAAYYTKFTGRRESRSNIKQLFKIPIRLTDTVGERDVQSAKAYITGQRTAPSKINMLN